MIHKYSVTFKPDVPDNSQRVRSKVINSIRSSKIGKVYEHFLFRGACIFTLDMVTEEHCFTTEYDETPYEITIRWVQEISRDSLDAFVFYKVFFNSLLKRLRLKEIGRKHFNPKEAKDLSQF